MEAAYTLLNVDRAVPEVWGSKYDVRELLKACYYAIDKKPVAECPLSLKEKALNEENVKKHILDKEIVKVIVIKGKVVNIVVK